MLVIFWILFFLFRLYRSGYNFLDFFLWWEGPLLFFGLIGIAFVFLHYIASFLLDNHFAR